MHICMYVPLEVGPNGTVSAGVRERCAMLGAGHVAEESGRSRSHMLGAVGGAEARSEPATAAFHQSLCLSREAGLENAAELRC